MRSRVRIEDFRRLHLILSTIFLCTLYANLCKKKILFSWSNKQHSFSSLGDIRVSSDQWRFAFSCIMVQVLFNNETSHKNELNGQLNESNYRGADKSLVRPTCRCIFYGKNISFGASLVLYTGCPRMNVRDFGRVFLMLNYTDITQNTYIQSSTVTEIMAIEKCGFWGVHVLYDVRDTILVLCAYPTTRHH